MTRWLVLILALCAALAPAVIAASVGDLAFGDVDCCCGSGAPTPMLRADVGTCCCTPKPAPLPHECDDWSLPSSAPTAVFRPVDRVLVDSLPREPHVSPCAASAAPARASPVRELLGVWLL